MRIRPLYNFSMPPQKQGYIYFACLTYDDQPKLIRGLIDDTIKAVCGGDKDKEDALFSFLKKGNNAELISIEHFITRSELYKLRRCFFVEYLDNAKKIRSD